jgi:hypothetical protein
MSGDCNSDVLNPNCTCGSRQQSSLSSKIYDFNAERYFCCGNISYDLAGVVATTPQAAAASLDYPECQGWWNSAVVPAQQFEYVNGTGPSQNKLNALISQNNISSAFPPPNIVAGVQNSHYDCTGVVSSVTTLATVPRFVTYPNPNNTGPTYVSTVACVGYNNLLGSPGPYNYLTGTSLGSTGNFAINNISECSSDLGSVTCTPTTALSQVTSGPQVFKANNFNGGGGGGGGGTSNSNTDSWWWILAIVIGAILVILIIIFIIWLIVRNRRPKVETSSGVVYGQPSNVVYGQATGTVYGQPSNVVYGQPSNVVYGQPSNVVYGQSVNQTVPGQVVYSGSPVVSSPGTGQVVYSGSPVVSSPGTGQVVYSSTTPLSETTITTQGTNTSPLVYTTSG